LLSGGDSRKKVDTEAGHGYLDVSVLHALDASSGDDNRFP